MTQQRSILNLLIFTLLVNGLAWLGPLLGGTPTEPGLGFLFWMTAPLVAALIMKFLLRDRVTFGIRPRLVANGRWYLLSLLVYPVVIPLVLLVGALFGATTFNDLSLNGVLMALGPTAVIYFVSALFEEAGWRGYLAPKMAGVNDRLLGHAIVGLIWASWHFPYMQELWAHTSEGLATLLPRFLLGTMISAVVYGEIRMRTNTFWPAVLMHGVGNTIANTLLVGVSGAGLVAFVPGMAWLGSFGVEGAVTMLLFALLGGWLYRQRVARVSAVVEPVSAD